MFRKKLEQKTVVKAGLLAAVAVLAAPGIALAQQATNTTTSASTSDEGQGVEDVVVTAQHRREHLQDVPIAVNAVTAGMLQQQGITEMRGLNLIAPNLNVVATVKTNLIYLRGIGQNSSSPGQEQTVSLYIDDLYVPAVSANVFNFNNINRVEVLRGPQGTLFGRNSTGGLVHVITRDPSHTFGGSFDFGYANYSTITADAYLTGPITNNLSADIAIQGSSQEDGWGHNLITGDKVNLGDRYNIRTKWLWEPDDADRVTLSLGYFRAMEDFGTARNVQTCARTTTGSCVPINPGIAGQNNVAPLSIYDEQGDTTDADDNRTWLGSVNIQHSFDWATLTSITGITNSWAHEILDTDNVPAFLSVSNWRERTQSFSQEVRLSSPDSSPVQWIAGYFFFDARAENTPNALLTPGGNITALDNRQDTASHAVFAQTTIPLGETTNLTVGGRYTYEQRDFSGYRYNQTGAIVTPYWDYQRHWTSPTFRVALDHHFTPNIMAYGSVSTGFKSGLYNPQGFAPTVSPPVNPEKLTDYEAGLKTEWFDHHLRLNLDAFHYDYRDIQLISFDGVVTTLHNAARATINGIELDGEAVVNSFLSFRGNIGYTPDAKFDSFPNASENVNVSGTGVTTSALVNATGNRLSRIPRITANLGADVNIPLGGAGSLLLAANGYYNDGFYYDNVQRLKEDPYSLFNASALWTAPGDGFTVRLWIDNIAGTEYCVNQNSGNNRLDVCAPGAPRTFGVTFGHSF